MRSGSKALTTKTVFDFLFGGMDTNLNLCAQCSLPLSSSDPGTTFSTDHCYTGPAADEDSIRVAILAVSAAVNKQGGVLLGIEDGKEAVRRANQLLDCLQVIESQLSTMLAGAKIPITGRGNSRSQHYQVSVLKPFQAVELWTVDRKVAVCDSCVTALLASHHLCRISSA